MGQYYERGCNLQIIDNSALKAKGIKLLEEMLLEVPEILDTAIGASSAPRHIERADDRRELKHIRRRWFGKKRGRVRHTFEAIELFLRNGANTLVVSTRGSLCVPGAHAYTPEGQTGNRLEICLCEKFFLNDATGQLSTIVHELTHLICDTQDHEVSSASDIDFISTADLVSQDTDDLARQKKAFFRDELGPGQRTNSAYNFEYFVADLIDETYDRGVLVPVRRG